LQESVSVSPALTAMGTPKQRPLKLPPAPPSSTWRFMSPDVIVTRMGIALSTSAVRLATVSSGSTSTFPRQGGGNWLVVVVFVVVVVVVVARVELVVEVVEVEVVVAGPATASCASTSATRRATESPRTRIACTETLAPRRGPFYHALAPAVESR
jgi:hypothetical protein